MIMEYSCNKGLKLIFPFGEVTEEVVVKDLGNAGEEVDIYILFLEDPIDVSTVAIQFLGKPVDIAVFRHLIKHFTDSLSDLHVFGFSHTGRTPPRQK